MQLLNETWLPVRKSNGDRCWIAPHQLTEPGIVAFDANRPDFNGALAQFAIALLQTASPVDSPIEWRKLFTTPPDSATLAAWFAPLDKAFELDGDKARFMQDLTLGNDEGSVRDIAALLIESPGENAIKNNTDHFIKRDRVTGMCPHCAATALFTLQVNAPAGGVGHRTGLRGGGPLTTLVMNQAQNSLWKDLWLNVFERRAFLAMGGAQDKTAGHFTFPWLAAQDSIQKTGGETAPIQVHPAHIYWAMPRRIRLDFNELDAGNCAICGRHASQLLTRYLTKNYGLNYKGPWNHPLSPYYTSKEDRLPLHPQPGGLGYRHWLGWVLGMKNEKKEQHAAAVVTHALQHRDQEIKGALRLWAFGYDMDNMKPRCWYESTLPLYGLADCPPAMRKLVANALQTEVGHWLNAAELAIFMLRGAVKDAWFSADARGDFSNIDAAFWSATEAPFYLHLKSLINDASSGELPDTQIMRKHWYDTLKKTALDLFDQVFVGSGPVERQNPQRVAKAWRQLMRNLLGPKMLGAAGLPVPENDKSKKPSKAGKTASPSMKESA